tara:strand:+ start:224 stop:724 length:501 start_codon:yes stop_codon:yes gene_type:complete
MFKTIGAAAATANLPFEFKIAEKKEDMDTNNKKGKVILLKSVANLNFSGSLLNPGEIKNTKPPINISAIIVRSKREINKKLKTELVKFSKRFLMLSLVKIGINAALNVPSANSLLKVFGKRKATKNASAKEDVPIKTAIRISLKYPKTLLRRVKDPNDPTALRIFI